MVVNAPVVAWIDLRPAVITNPLVVAPDLKLEQGIALMGQAQSVSESSGLSSPAWDHQRPLADPVAHHKGRSTCLVVTEIGQVVGLITAAEIVRLGPNLANLSQLSVRDLMVRPRHVLPQAELAGGVNLSELWQHIAHGPMPVVDDDGRLIGLITLESLLTLNLPYGQLSLPDSLPTRALTVSPLAGVSSEPQNPPLAGVIHEQQASLPQLLYQQSSNQSAAMLHDIVNSTRACIIQSRVFPDSTWVNDYYSAGSELIFGFSAQALLNQPDLWAARVLPEDFQTVLLPAVQAVIEGHAHSDLEFRFIHGDGSPRWIGESRNTCWQEAQQCWVVTSVALDITDRKHRESQLKQSAAELQALFRAMDELILVLDHQGRFLKIVSTDSGILYRPASELLGNVISDMFPADQAAQFLEVIHRTLALQTTQELEYALTIDDQIRWFNARCSPIAADQVIWVARDVSERARIDEERKQNELSLRRSEAKRRAILAAMPDLMFRLGADGRYREVINSRPDLEMFFKGRDPIGKRLIDLVPAEIANRKLAIKDRALATGELQLYEQKLDTDDGPRYEEIRVIKSGDDEVLFMIRDISDRKRAQAQIIHNALHDPLTDLPNRMLLEERLKVAIRRAKRQRSYCYAVLFIDLDRFKVINDSLGHLVGDKLLVAIAQRIQGHIRESDLAARLGGDEFVLLLENIDGPDTAAQIAERLLADCQVPLTIDNHEVFTGMSIGIALGNSRYTVASDVIRDADIAMYRAKQNRQASYQFFGSAMHTEMLERHTLEMELHRAIEQDELVVYYQPIFDLAQNRLVGFEALVRWLHPRRGFLSPQTFLSCAEDSGLIVPIDRWVLAQSGHQLKQWQQAHGHSLRMHVNLSAQNFTTSNFLQSIDRVLEEVALPAPWLTVEITENILIDDIGNATELLNQLADRQIQTSIDDFGIGYSSLQYLHRLPLQSLKIDRSFVHEIDTSDRDYQMVKTIAGLGHQLNLEIIAEGIENHHQLQIIQKLGCQFGQGYLFARPLPAAQIEPFLLSLRQENE
jgi:diguanylate cyclase (GGDEF)-like protein